MSLLVGILKVLPYVLAFVTISAVIMLGMVAMRVMRGRMDKATIILGVAGGLCALLAFVCWRALFRYWNSGPP